MMKRPLSKPERMELRKAIGNREVPGPPVTPYFRGPDYRVAHACFHCRKSWKLSEESSAICPSCTAPLHWMGRAFKAPRKSDLEQWAKVELLWRAGFRFLPNTRWREIEPFPERLNEAKRFIEENPDHPFRVKT